LKTHFSDVVATVQLTDGQPADIYILFEHKSGPDILVRIQVLKYMVQKWFKWIKDRNQFDGYLPIVIPMVLQPGISGSVPNAIRAFPVVCSQICTYFKRHIPYRRRRRVSIDSGDDSFEPIGRILPEQKSGYLTVLRKNAHQEVPETEISQTDTENGILDIL